MRDFLCWGVLNCKGRLRLSADGGLSHLGLHHFAAFVTIPGDKLQPVRILAGPSGIPLVGGRSGRLNEVLDAGCRIPGLWLLQPESGSRGLPRSRVFRAAGGGGFRKSSGRTGRDPVDTCPGRTAAGPGFDSRGGGLGTCPAPHFSGQRDWRRWLRFSPPPLHNSSSF